MKILFVIANLLALTVSALASSAVAVADMTGSFYGYLGSMLSIGSPAIYSSTLV